MISPSPHAERPIGELFSELATETSSLVRQEVKLATTELTQKATYAGKQAGYVAVGSLLFALSLLVLLAALVLGLGNVMPLWESALLVGGLVGVVAFVVIQHGLSALRKLDPTPKQTVLSLKEDKKWVQEQVR